jgi:hypothetical protein
MRRAHVRTTAKVSASEVPASKVPASAVSSASVLRQSDGNPQAEASQHTGCNQQNFSEERITMDKARHTGTLPAASQAKAARIARS